MPGMPGSSMMAPAAPSMHMGPGAQLMLQQPMGLMMMGPQANAAGMASPRGGGGGGGRTGAPRGPAHGGGDPAAMTGAQYYPPQHGGMYYVMPPQ